MKEVQNGKIANITVGFKVNNQRAAALPGVGEPDCGAVCRTAGCLIGG